MNTRNIVVCSALMAGVLSSSVRLSAQDVSPGFNLGWKEGVATVVKDGSMTAFRVPVEAKVVKGAPFSADIVTESIQTLADGNRIVQRSNTRMYRDSEGRVRREESRGTGSAAISITDPVSGVAYALDPDSRVARQMPTFAGFRFVELQNAVHEQIMRIPPVAVDKLKTFPDSAQWEIERRIQEVNISGGAIGTGVTEQVTEQVKVERLPARDIEGVRAEGTRRTTTIAAGAIGNELPIEVVSEEWVSVDLKVLVMTERRDPRLGTSTYRLVNIIRAEPDHDLFEVPSDYTMMDGLVHKAGPALRK
jgi:hypothetical protein